MCRLVWEEEQPNDEDKDDEFFSTHIYQRLLSMHEEGYRREREQGREGHDITFRMVASTMQLLHESARTGNTIGMAYAVFSLECIRDIHQRRFHSNFNSSNDNADQ